MSYPRLLADIGGTNARFALENENGELEHIRTLPCADFNTVVDAARSYISSAGDPRVKFAAFAIANPVTGDWVQMTNHHWAFSIETTRQLLGLEKLLLINDFTAQAYAVANLKSDEFVQVGGKEALENFPKAVIGPGTGLGVSGLIPDGRGGYVALAGEGGHNTFPPFDDTELFLWRYAKAEFGHVSAERFLNGAGLVMIYEALAHRDGVKCEKLLPADISRLALSGESPLCRQVLDLFCAMLGTVSSNLALTLGARGGVYICGGIIPRFVEYFKTSPFRSRFENKGRFDAYLAAIPVFVVTAKYPGISGVAIALKNDLANNGVV